MVTILNLSLKEKKKQTSIKDNVLPVQSEAEIAAGKMLNRLHYELNETTSGILTLENNITAKEKQLEDNKKSAEQQTALRTSEKVEAIQALSSKQNQLTNDADNIRTKIDDLPAECKASIEVYRQELAILQLINDYPQSINYHDVQSINL